MRPVFCGNFDYETRQSELDRLFSKYGRVDRVDMKSGFAFVYFDDERDADDAIRDLDGRPFGYSRHKLSVEWARQGERGRYRDSSRAMANMRSTKTLFVINFDPIRTRIQDIERHFEPYGNVLHVRIQRNFSFVQFETQEEAMRALECTNMRTGLQLEADFPQVFIYPQKQVSMHKNPNGPCSKILDGVVSVEYALRNDGEGGDRHGSPRRGGGYGRRDSPYGRPLSPLCRGPGRPSPDYGCPRSSVYDRYNGPAYDRHRSSDYGGYRSRSTIRRSRT